jgi:hypothetical protein
MNWLHSLAVKFHFSLSAARLSDFIKKFLVQQEQDIKDDKDRWFYHPRGM